MNRIERTQLGRFHPSSLAQDTIVHAEQPNPAQHLLAARDRLGPFAINDRATSVRARELVTSPRRARCRRSALDSGSATASYQTTRSSDSGPLAIYSPAKAMSPISPNR